MRAVRGKERRQSPRRNIEIGTTLIYKDLSISECRTRDIGFGGAFVYTPTSAPPERSDVKMLLIRRDKTIPLIFKSEVIQSTNEGAALRFQEVSNEANEALVDLLFSWQPPAAMTSAKPAPIKATGGHDIWK